ncbi:galactokinase [Mucor velutinosus]|uniref:Galactokinase n=1 Tax=Mucor velutinosus TaxID=708070 RepID=A0AAN7DJB5_9FUNG|nr:galactokinase [Mucor velutinosus]
MTRSLTQSALPQQLYNQEELANEWEEAYHNKSNSLLKRSNVNNNATSNTFNHYNVIFSDDDEDDLPPQQHGLTSRWFHTQQQNHSSTSAIPSSNATMSAAAGYIDPVLSSSTYHIHQADNALLTLKHVILEDGWKKALKHKSGVMVHMKNGIHKGDRIPIFKGEAIIQGFSPQAIFYVIGMRKLWDEQYEDGNLVENLNDTTSLTYEDTQDEWQNSSQYQGKCTLSFYLGLKLIEPQQLQGWVLEPLHGGPHPATKVIFVVQESMKGWVPGFAKKTLARRPLVIAKVAEYLERKTERMRSQQANKSGLLQSINSGHSRRPSVMSSHLPQQMQPLGHFNSANRLQAAPSEHLHRPTILVAPQQQQQQQQPTPIIAPPPQPSSIGTSSSKKHISFAEHDITYTASHPPQSVASLENSPTSTTTTNPYRNVLPVPAKNNTAGRHLYPSHRHPIQKVESIQLLKKLTFSLDNWNLTKELDDGSKYYTLNARLLSDDEEESMLQMTKSSKSNARKVPFVRADGIIQGGWTAEQLCSVIHCFGSRKIWDSSFEGGQTIERFSQKEYLVQWYLGSMLPIASVDLSAITSIETDPITGTVYTATTSVTDQQVPPDDVGHRIRAYTDLYGWVFRPKFDKHGRTVQVAVSFVCNMDFKYALPQHVLQAWMDTSLQSITHMHHYLTQYGCPPYIRRVAGKVVQEGFDALTNNYQIVFIAKHQPSNSYRARKQNQSSSLWCTDIRFHRTMFPHGLDIKIMPENVARVQISPKEQKSIKVFTTDATIDGKQVTFTLTPLHHSEATHYTTYKYNGELFTQQQPQAILDNSSKSDGETTASSEPNTPNAATTKFVNNKQVIVDGESSLSSTSTAGTSAPIPAAADVYVADTASVVAEAVVQVLGKDTEKKHDVTTPSITVTKVEIEKTLKKEETEKVAEVEQKDALPIPLKVPKGYLLVPEHQNNNIIIITDELSFNGQQISVIFLAMVICYYMGKFISCSSC